MSGSLRWGAPVYRWEDAEQWALRHTEQGLSAAYWPPVPSDQNSAFVNAAQRADVVIAEVGAWSNPLSSDEAARRKALSYCTERLALADEVGALCCVNIAGSLSERWDGPCAENFSDDAFDRIVDTVRRIIDGANPQRTFYTLELMPWIWPWDADSYLALIRAIDRPRFAVHLDPANTMASPQLFYANTKVYQDLGPQVPLMLEHLPDEAAYSAALGRLRASGLMR